MSTIRVFRKGIKLAAWPLGAVSRPRPGDVVIMCYHRVGSGSREIDIPRRAFVDHLAALAAQECVRTLDQALSSEDGGVVLTFDDGFRDFYDVVLPMLVGSGIPALLYLATGFVDVGDLRSGVGPEGALTWSMLDEAVSTGLVTLGSHTHGHVDLTRASGRTAEEEMRRSKELIEDRLGQPCTHFAFPWGKTSPAAERVVRRHYQTAAVEAWRTNRSGRTDLYRLGRTPVLRSDSAIFFRAKVRGQLHGERLAYRALRRGPWAPS